MYTFALQVDDMIGDDDGVSEGEIPSCDNIQPEVGNMVAKTFEIEVEGKKRQHIFRGRITDVNVDNNGEKLYHVKYDDGDSEDLNFRECRMACILHIKIPDSDSDSEDE